jgi:hypothetical protein
MLLLGDRVKCLCSSSRLTPDPEAPAQDFTAPDTAAGSRPCVLPDSLPAAPSKAPPVLLLAGLDCRAQVGTAEPLQDGDTVTLRLL